MVVQSQPRQIVPETLPGKKPFTKRTGRVVHDVGPEFKPQYRKQTNEQTNKTIYK
jgi:hypothetical protein